MSLAVKAGRGPMGQGRVLLWAAVGFLIFGASDVVETQRAYVVEAAVAAVVEGGVPGRVRHLLARVSADGSAGRRLRRGRGNPREIIAGGDAGLPRSASFAVRVGPTSVGPEENQKALDPTEVGPTGGQGRGCHAIRYDRTPCGGVVRDRGREPGRRMGCPGSAVSVDRSFDESSP